MNIKEFGAKIDSLLTDAPVQMLITFPEGTLKPEIEDSHGLGVVINYYMMLNVLKELLRELIELDLSPEKDGSGVMDSAKIPTFIDNVIDLIKAELKAEYTEVEDDR